MDIEIIEEGPDSLAEYATISIAYDVAETLVLDPSHSPVGLEGIRSSVIPIPFWKDYDAEPGNDPLSWTHRWPRMRKAFGWAAPPCLLTMPR